MEIKSAIKMRSQAARTTAPAIMKKHQRIPATATILKVDSIAMGNASKVLNICARQKSRAAPIRGRAILTHKQRRRTTHACFPFLAMTVRETV